MIATGSERTRAREEMDLLASVAAQVAGESRSSAETLTDEAWARAWTRVTELGFAGLAVPEERGGLGASGSHAAVVVREFARRLTPMPVLGSGVLAARLLVECDAPVDLVEEAAAGTTVAAVVLDRDLGRLAPGGLDTGSGVAFQSRGARLLLGAGEDADSVVAVRLDGELPAMEPFDLCRSLARVPPGCKATVVGSVTPAARDRWHAWALVMVAADLLGVMVAATDRAVEYASARQQFGRPIGAFQAIQHHVANMFVVQESAADAVAHAAWALDHLETTEALSAARVAKAYASSVGLGVVERMLQVFGGIGMTWEFEGHLQLRRALLDRVLLGDEATHYQVIAGQLLA